MFTQTSQANQLNATATQDSQRMPGRDDSSLSRCIARSSSFERWIIRKLLHQIGANWLAVELWDGRVIRLGGTERQRIRLTERGHLLKLLLNPNFEFAERYVRGQIEVDGNLTDLMVKLFQLKQPQGINRRLENLQTRLRAGSRSLQASRNNVSRHYDLGNDFYRLWLDEQLLYTCAYFESPEQTLEAAQFAKMDYICRKLCLKPGDRVIETGCGWGALAMHMVRHYGAVVKAYNISREQISYARSLACLRGIADRVEFIEEDWRNIKGSCDAFVSVGMLEHVGPENFKLLGEVIHNCLTPSGRGLIHSIGLNWKRPLDCWTATRIFPGAQPPALSEAMQIFECNDMNVYDVENLQWHYAQTLRHWLSRFEGAVEEVREMFDEEFVRMWRLYLASSIASFETGLLELFQIVFAPRGSRTLPQTRRHLYASSPQEIRGAVAASHQH